MRSVICGGYRHQSIDSCAAYHGVTRTDVETALYTTGRLDGELIRFGPDNVPEKFMVVHGGPLLSPGYCVHRLGTYHGGRY